MSDMILPVRYSTLEAHQRISVRAEYVNRQNRKCWCCHESLDLPPPTRIVSKQIDWSLFPKNFLKYPIHLHHDHKTDKTIGAVHNRCNAVLWQYHGE